VRNPLQVALRAAGTAEIAQSRIDSPLCVMA